MKKPRAATEESRNEITEILRKVRKIELRTRGLVR
jgi:predicted transposase YbfD/YdcC